MEHLGFQSQKKKKKSTQNHLPPNNIIKTIKDLVSTQYAYISLINVIRKYRLTDWRIGPLAQKRALLLYLNVSF